MELKCKVQNYDWGKLGNNSTVAKLLSSADQNETIDQSKPYAELWMGTHPNGPALIIERDVLLSDYIKDNLDAIGPAVRKQFGVAVPFLLKVLSIRKALSIQAHPKKFPIFRQCYNCHDHGMTEELQVDFQEQTNLSTLTLRRLLCISGTQIYQNAEHAEELHRNSPEMYKDPNHKPELAIALTPFEALCGFRPLSEIKEFIKNVPELKEILSEDSVDLLLACDEGDDDKVLKQVFESLMSCNRDAIAGALQKLLTRLEKEDSTKQLHLLYLLLKRLHADFPGDVGCFAPYFMNYMELRPGQAIFLKPNLPHAYLSGDCVECMACSDNVVRAGLTPKHIDLPTLVRMLDYTSYTKENLLFNPQMEDANSCIWRPPVPDFAVVKIRVEGGDSYNTIIRPSPSLIIIISGAGEVCDTEPVQARPGVAVFLKASRQLTITPDDGNHIEAYQAICNV